MDRLFPLKTAAEILAVSPDFLKRLHRAGRIRVVRLNRNVVRISETELQRLVREGLPRVGAK